MVGEDVQSSSTPEEEPSSSNNEEVEKMFEIKFQNNLEERISRFEQNDEQRKDKKCTVITYYSNGVSYGAEKAYEMEINDNNVKYINSVLAHNQKIPEHIIELEEQLEDLINQEGEFNQYWADLYKHQTDYTTFVTEDNKVFEIIGRGDFDIDYHHKVIHNVDIEYKGEMPRRMHFWKANILGDELNE